MECPRPDSDIASNCRVKNSVYKARMTILSNNGEEETKNYIGSSSRELKERVSFHNSCNRSERLKNSTELSKLAHKVHEEGKNFTISWDIMETAPKLRPGDKFCHLCNAEMYNVIFKRDSRTINHFKMEPCLHRKAVMLRSVTG